MKNRRWILFYVLLFQLLPGKIIAQNFGQLGKEEGLSQNNIKAIIQDYTGFLWIGTGDGLNRYDGCKFQVFYQDLDDSTSISNNQISALALAPDSSLWIGTDKGLNRFDPKTNKFNRFGTLIPGNSQALINNLLIDDRGVVWYSCIGHSSIMCFNPASGKTGIFKFPVLTPGTGIKHSIGRNFKALYSNAIAAGDHDCLWIGTTYGTILCFDKSRREFVDEIQVVKNNFITSITVVSSQELNVTTVSHGCFTVNTRKKTIDPLFNLQDKALYDLLSDLYLSTMDKTNHLFYFGTINNGLVTYDPVKKRIDQELFVPQYANQIVHRGVCVLYIDHGGTLWCGTSGYGVFYISPSLEKFKTINHQTLFRKTYSKTSGFELTSYHANQKQVGSLSFQSVRGIYANERIILTGGYNGLNKIDRKTGEVSIIDNALIAYVIKPDGDEPDRYVWIGTESSGVPLFLMDLKSNSLIQKGLQCNYVFSLLPEKNHTLWLGTPGQLIRYNTLTGKTERYSNDPADPKSIQPGDVKALCRDRKGVLWIGTSLGGICSFDENAKTFCRYQYKEKETHGLNNNMVLALYADPLNQLWVATGGGGVNILDPGRKNFRHLTTKQGLPNDFIYGILEDDQKMIWGSTNKGIFKLNPKNGNVTCYDESDGLQNNEFNTGSYYNDLKGTLFFGGINGLNYFKPEDVKENLYNPRIILTSVKVFDQLVSFDKPYYQSKDLILSYKSKIFTIGFSALSFVQSWQNEYAYKMTGLGDDWIKIGTRHEIGFKNLSPGEYTLEIKASNNDGVWSNHHLFLKIIIVPPFWNTWWFYLLFVIIVIIIIALFIRYRIASVRKQNQTLSRQIEERTKEIIQQKEEIEMQKEKLDQRVKERTVQLENLNKEITAFSYAIAHDLRSPLRAMNGYAQFLLDDHKANLNAEGEDFLQKINTNSVKMAELIDHLLSFARLSRSEINRSALKMKPLVLSVINECCSDVEQTRIRFIVSDLPDLFADPVMIRQVMTNLISNSVKFTQKEEKPVIEIGYEIRNNECIYFISDNGVGFDMTFYDKLFGVFQRLHGITEFSGHGIGLTFVKAIIDKHGGRIWAESKEKEGATFFFTIPG